MESNMNFDQWKWVQLNKNELHAVWDQETMLSGWLANVRKNNNNCVKVHGFIDEERVVNGSLIYRQNVDAEEDRQIFHFYITSNTLFTVDLEFTSFKQLEPDVMLRQLNKTENAVDGFLFLLGELVNDILVEIDQFEVSLQKLMWGVKKQNNMRILEHIFQQRHELLVCNNLLIPIQELKMAIEETNFPNVNNGEIFIRTCKRIERAMVLLREYEQEIDSVIHLEEVISSHRGNEIMKTLTVLTTIFTPIMAFGALWGMNFKHMPELEWKYGYLISIISIILSTALLYGYIKTKGWTGDLLKGKKKGSFFR
ncbi:magnesium transporter CorA family protein [Neobacillus sp. DY30]|uniref:magnesium transporter CorA family protein n=1 Tax=Neobacillus sp. DY30 TaxID=3047871 RepID=UPI0024BF8214|nr:magnesium transporter CorA family protein [Neobacillus sp. DY30]WHY00527.1 magnesium transporter CorA family protein [Neobacillus sp. DY30]